MPNAPVGVDISNTHLDVSVVPAGQAARVPNDAAGFTALIAWVAGPVRAVTDEPTGRWHRAFEAARPTEASSSVQRALEALPVVRDALVKNRTAALNRQQQGRHRLLQQPHTHRLAQHRPASGRHRYRDREAAGRRRGAGPADRDLDVDPGRVSRHRGGPADPDAGARPLLYMPALAATRYNPDLRATYRQLVAEGTPRTVAVVVVMRKLLLLANVLLDPDRAAGSPTGPGGTACRSSRHDRCLRVGLAWLREGL